MNRSILILTATIAIFGGGTARGQVFTSITDEAQVSAYTLPDPLVMSDSSPVTDVVAWRTKRRPEILALFEKYVYGKMPGPLASVHFKLISTDKNAYGGSATRKEVRVFFTAADTRPYMDVLIYIPNGVRKPVPAFMGLSFYGNHTVTDDPAVILSDQWMRTNSAMKVVAHRATEASRGLSKSRWPIATILARGYALVTIYCGDIDPDWDDGFQNGIHPLFYRRDQMTPENDEWGTIGAWAWGLSRALDYLGTDDDIDAKRVAVMGHSRLGKTSLWAGATDERFAMVISNDSGCGGAALSRRRFGETVAMINTNLPHWFCDNFNMYNNIEDKLPVDQHMLIALMAPRPVYVASAAADLHADPRGEYLSAYLASPVYALFGLSGLPSDTMPPVDHPVAGTIGYHVRTGGHNVTDFDWAQYLDFADRHLGQ